MRNFWSLLKKRNLARICSACKWQMNSSPLTMKALSVSTKKEPRLVTSQSNRYKEWSHSSRQAGGVVALSALLAGFFSFLKKDEGKEEDPLILTLKRARLAEHKREFPEAEKLYHEALAVVYQQEREDTISNKKALQAKVYIFDYLANLALATQQVEKAEKLFTDTMKGLLQLEYAKDDNAIVEISLKLAMCHALEQKYTEAEQGYKFCMETMVKKLELARGKDEDVDQDLVALAGMSFDAYSRYLIMRKRLSEALDVGQKSITLAKEVFGETHAQVAVLLSDRATSLTMMGHYAEAEHYIREAIKIGEKLHSVDLPVFYCNLGIVMMEQDKLTESAKACQKALTLAQAAGFDIAVNQAQTCLDKVKEKQYAKK